MVLFACQVCGKKMSEKYKAAHLAGRPHAVKVAAVAAGGSAHEPIHNKSYQRRRDTPSEISPEPVHETYREKPAEFEKAKWKCTTCNCIMKTQYKRCHLGSKTHNTKLIASGGVPEFWNCNICNTTMEVQHQTQHLSGKRHIQNLKSKPQSKNQHQTPAQTTYPTAGYAEVQERPQSETQDQTPEQTTSPTAGYSEAQERAQPEIQDQSPAQATSPKTGYTGVKERPQAEKKKGGPPHPNGKRFIKVSEVKDVYDDVDDIPSGAWVRAKVNFFFGKDTLVTAEEVQAARDQYEMFGDDGDDGDGDDGDYDSDAQWEAPGPTSAYIYAS